VRQIERVEAHFCGHVQGVGFRYTAVSLARGYPVTGWVKNLPDGRVLLTAEGERKDLDALIAEIESEMGGYVTRVEKTFLPATGEFSRFSIAL